MGPVHGWEHEAVQPLWETVWRFLKKLNTEWPYDPAVLLLGRYAKELKAESRRYWHTMCIAAWLTKANTWSHPSVHWQVKGKHTVDYFSASEQKGLWHRLQRARPGATVLRKTSPSGRAPCESTCRRLSWRRQFRGRQYMAVRGRWWWWGVSLGWESSRNDGGDGCRTIRMYLMPLKCTLQHGWDGTVYITCISP